MKAKILSAIGSIVFVVLAASCTTIEPVSATGNGIGGSKVGEASANFLFSVIPLPFSVDYSIEAAAKNGGISKISTVDMKTFNVLNLWMRKTTIVTGE